MEVNEVNEVNKTNEASQDEKAQELLEQGVSDAQQVIQDPSKVEYLLEELEDKLNKHPAIGKTLSDLPLMIEMLKAWDKKEYTEVSPKTVTRLISATQYLVKENDLLWDNIPVVGMADDLAVMGLALRRSKQELKAFSEWKQSHGDASL